MSLLRRSGIGSTPELALAALAWSKLQPLLLPQFRINIQTMSTITFDTLKFVERLEKAGATRELATAMAEAQREAFAEALDTALATKSDIRTVRDDVVKVERRMDGLDSKLDKLQWMVGIVIALAIANFAKQYF